MVCNEKWRMPKRKIATAPARNLPDVYYIILDAYGRADSLKTFYGYDNTPFLQALEQRGFYIARHSRANYDQTPLCLASALNFLSGQIVANTTLVPIASGSSESFALFNNSDGATHVVVDVVGYFWEYQAGDCAKVSQSQSIGAGGNAAVQAVCSAGFVPQSGGCSANTASAITWVDRRNTVNGLGYSCGAFNGSAGSVMVTTDTWCCRKAGR